MKIVVFTSDKHMWLLRGFFHQWEKCGGLELGDIEVAGFTVPSENLLPEYASFCSIGKFENYPISKWSNAVIKYLESIPNELVLILLEDYWMLRKINLEAVGLARKFMKVREDVMRFDLAADRCFNKSSVYVGNLGSLDLCEAKADYSLSFQASIYRREWLLKFMKPDESPWEAEIYGSHRLNRSLLKVVGTYQWPMNYMIVVNKGKVDRSGNWMYPARTFYPVDWKDLEDSECLLDPEAVNEQH